MTPLVVGGEPTSEALPLVLAALQEVVSPAGYHLAARGVPQLHGRRVAVEEDVEASLRTLATFTNILRNFDEA
jgi:hypothetical protein